MSQVRPLYLSMSYQDSADHGRLILRDGSSAIIRLSEKSDIDAVRAFYQRLSPQSRRMRFFSESKPGDDIMLSLCESSDPRRGMTLLVLRHADGAQRIIATGSYIAHNDTTAEFAVAVDDTFQGKGLGGLIFERLSVLAASHGFLHFNAFTHVNNASMLEVFRNSGFQLREQFQDGMVEVNLSLVPGKESVSYAQRRDRLFTKASIRPFFHPRSVAVIGASRDAANTGHRLFMSVLRHQFTGVVYPVNPNASQISGVKAYRTVEEIPEPVDLAIIAVPRDDVDKVVDECARRGVRALIVVSTGFAESGEEGARRQQALVEKVRSYGMRLLGPNCLGVINTDPEVQLNASLSSDYPIRGRVALSSQSGGLGMALLNLARRRNIGLSTFISMGNKADVTGNDLLYYWEDDQATDVILLYLESFGNPRRFGRIAREVSRRKPIICVKSGRHRLSPEEHVVDAMFQQTGVVRVQTLEEMFDVAALMGAQPFPPGRRVHIITNSRGAGVMGEDACDGNDLLVQPIRDLTAAAGPDDYQRAVADALAADDIDIIVILFNPVTDAPSAPVLDAICTAQETSRPAGGTPKTIVLVMMGDGASGSITHHRGFSFPCYQFPEKAARALASAARYREWRDAPVGFIPDYEDVDIPAIRKVLASPANTDSSGWLDRDSTSQTMKLLGVAITNDLSRHVMLLDLKVELNRMFGPVISLALIGYNHHAATTVSHRMAPLTDQDAWSLIESVTGFRLNGNRLTDESVDWSALHELILRVSFLVEEFPEIEQVQLSPVFVYRKNQGCAAGKVRIRRTMP